MGRPPFILHIRRQGHPPSRVEDAITCAGCGVLTATTLNEVMYQLPLASVIVISPCWTEDEKHRFLNTLAQRSSAPVICIHADAAHLCGACTEVKDSDPAGLVAAIENAVKSAGRAQPLVIPQTGTK